MTQEARDQEMNVSISRRKMLRGAGVAVGTAVLAPQWLRAQTASSVPVGPPTTITQPPRDFSPQGAPTTYFTDPDVLTIEPAFDGMRQPNAPIQRLWTGALWSEGPAWSAEGKYLVWSDIPNNRQLRWIEDDGRVTVFRTTSCRTPTAATGSPIRRMGRSSMKAPSMRRGVPPTNRVA